MAVTPIEDGEVALVLAVAHRAVCGAAAVAHLGAGVLQIPGTAPFTEAPTFVVTDREDLMSLAIELPRAIEGPGARVCLATDPKDHIAEARPRLSLRESWFEP